MTQPAISPTRHVTPRSAYRCLCCALTRLSNGARSPGRCRRAPAQSPGTPGCGPSRPGPGWTRGWGRSWCLPPELWRRWRSGTPASLGGPHPGTVLEGCWGSDDAEAGGGGGEPGCPCCRAEAPDWTLTRSLQNQTLSMLDR